MPKMILETTAPTEWGAELLKARMGTVGRKRTKGAGHWPMDRGAFVETRINSQLTKKAAVSVWTYMRWERGERTPREKRQEEVRNAIKKSAAGGCVKKAVCASKQP